MLFSLSRVTCYVSRKVNMAFEPKILGIFCNWCSYTGADLAGTTRIKYAPNMRIVRVMCSGRVDPQFILKAFKDGADGVLVAGCHPGDCHYMAGNYHARRRFAVFRELMLFAGIHPDRLHFSWVSAAEGNKWASIVDEVTQKVAALGPASPVQESHSR